MKNYLENPPLNISEKICFIISTLLLFSCLIKLDFFIYSGLFNYFALVIGSSTILTAIFFRKYRTIKNNIVILITLPFVLFLLWVLFVFIQLGTAIQYKQYHIAICFTFIASVIVLRKDNAITFYKAVAFIAIVESVWCILQYLGKIPSESIDFRVTGSFTNPNVVAMFLALSLPALLYFCFIKTKVYETVINYSMLALVCIGLLLLECRTAILGSVFSCGLFLILRFNIIDRYKPRYLFFGVIVIGILSTPIGREMYLHKKDSADGRMLIWNISLQMVKDSPIRGYGTGMFEREYNLKQAKEIHKGKLNQSQLKNASFVQMAYNEYIEQAIEGGIPAVIVFIAMIFSFLYLPSKKIYVTIENQENKKTLCRLLWIRIICFDGYF